MINELITRVGKARTLQEQETKHSLIPSGLGKVYTAPTHRLTFISEPIWRKLTSSPLSPLIPHLLFLKKQQIKKRNASPSFFWAETLPATTGCQGRGATMTDFIFFSQLLFIRVLSHLIW